MAVLYTVGESMLFSQSERALYRGYIINIQRELELELEREREREREYC